jgi:nicotinate-nucleotide adenylyltransferase
MRRRQKSKLPLSERIGRLGILGGTFDPVHNGHLVCAEQLREAIGLDAVLFVPCSRPPHKRAHRPAPAEHRMAMVELAVGKYEGFEVSDYEVAKGGVSYTIDTVEHLRQSLGQDAELWLLIGMDTYLEIPTWKRPDEVVAECFFGVARRPGYEKKLMSFLPRARTKFVDITSVDISSTDIRERLREGRSIRFLVPDAVEDYIRAKRPYPSRRQA